MEANWGGWSGGATFAGSAAVFDTDAALPSGDVGEAADQDQESELAGLNALLEAAFPCVVESRAFVGSRWLSER